MTRREWLAAVLVALGAGAAGFGYNAWRSAATDETERIAAALAAAELPGLDGRPQALRQWRGKVLVVNFWATWCGPCREEIPVFIRLQDRYRQQGLQFVGIAVDDAARVRSYASELGINFPLLIAGMGGIELARVMGNKAAVLPFSLIVTREGVVAARHVGAYKEAQLEPVLTALLKP